VKLVFTLCLCADFKYVRVIMQICVMLEELIIKQYIWFVVICGSKLLPCFSNNAQLQAVLFCVMQIVDLISHTKQPMTLHWRL